MYIFRRKSELENYLLSLKNKGLSIGFVPTMGALHQGHFALVKTAVAQNDVTVCSIFVNPTQFNDSQDFEKYPVQVDKDIRMLIETGASVLFLPDASEIYPDGMQQSEYYDFGELEKIAEGVHRPGHFQGVGQVLSRLVTLIVHPDRMYLGQKDYQQLLITKKLMKILNLKVEIVSVPIEREADGLAMSSRNARLSEEARKVASAIYESLCMVKDHKRDQPLEQLLRQATQYLEDKGFRVEYLMLANAGNLQQENTFKSTLQVLLIAAWLDGVRLIDNILLKP